MSGCGRSHLWKGPAGNGRPYPACRPQCRWRPLRLNQLAHHILQLLAQKHGYDRRRRLIGSQPVIIAHIGSGLAQQIRMGVHTLHDTGQHQQKLYVFIGCLARIQHIDAVIRYNGPVVMLAGAVHAFKRLFVKKAGQTVAAATFFIVSMMIWLWSTAILACS